MDLLKKCIFQVRGWLKQVQIIWRVFVLVFVLEEQRQCTFWEPLSLSQVTPPLSTARHTVQSSRAIDPAGGTVPLNGERKGIYKRLPPT